MPPTVIYANKPKNFSLWDSHKDVLKELYLTQKKPLKDAKQVMESEHGFNCDFTTYETTLRDHLGFRKNLKRSDWEAIGTHHEKRQGKESEITFLGDRLTQKRVAKEVDRYRPRMDNASIPMRVPTLPLPASIDIRTPPPASLKALASSQSSENAIVARPRTQWMNTNTELVTRFILGNKPDSVSLQNDMNYLHSGRFSKARANLPINEFAVNLLKLS
ncbi:hypothetical protein PG994_000794 [Apiospora phragmitis]|uniref:Clr5 domain-containing protein n=1 Tax=Apiospora phragmitis TaxID=2905665 RepID=A0ABR1X7F8_9PEZI